jgi:hypothetical protein
VRDMFGLGVGLRWAELRWWWRRKLRGGAG